MNRHVKHLVIAAATALLFSGQAMACGGARACMADKGTMQQGQGGSCPYQGHMPAGATQTHAKKIPGASSDYVRRMLRNGEQLGLSAEQRKQIEEILVTAEKEAAEAAARADTVVADFYGRLRTKKTGAADIDAYARRMGELHAARLKANLTASIKASELLTPEQKKKFYAGSRKR